MQNKPYYECPLCEEIMPKKDFIVYGHKCDPHTIERKLGKDYLLSSIKQKKHTCWNCNEKFSYEGEQYCDVICPHCKVMNSIYKPQEPQPKPEEPESTLKTWLDQEETMPVPYVTDKQIKDDCDALLKECLEWSRANFSSSWRDEDIRQIGITRFLYLKDKLFNHSPKYYRDKELHHK